jgi:sugar phosphate isomerase/epimerase
MLHIGVSSYSYHRLFDMGLDGREFTVFDCVDKAKETGFEGIEFVPFKVPEGKDAVGCAREIADYCRQKDLPVTCYSIGSQLVCTSKEALDAEIARICREVDVAAALGAPKMRHDVTFGFPDDYKGMRTFDAVLPTLADACRRITQYAKTKGIVTMVENHGQICQDSARVLRLVETVNDPNYGVLCDMGNFTCADEDPAVAVGNVLPVTRHVHIKDMFVKSGMLPDPGEGWFRSRAGNYIRCTIVGHGDVPVMQCLRSIISSGYDGFVNLEFEGIEETFMGIELGYKNAKTFLALLAAQGVK